jgi:hypothetical protein
MQTIELYIESQRVDMFKDESVSITQGIQNVKDISKVFTDFSKTFTLPASKINNKIFKHYYNFDIENGFDARTKKDAYIELNSIPFLDGKIKLEGVDLKNNKAYSYKVTFFGSTVVLKDLLGEDKLSSLNSLNSLSETYSPTDIEAGLKRNPASNDVVVPLITHTKRLFYDSTTGHAHGDLYSGNLYYEDGNSHRHGVAWNELKYALRVDNIIKAIEANPKYNIKFSDDFFNSTNLPYYNLFMWLHRKKGEVGSGTQVAEYTSLIDGWTTEFGSVSQMINDSTFKIGTTNLSVDTFTLTLSRTTTQPYDISILRNGIEEYSESNITSTNKVINLFPYVQDVAEYQVVLTYESAISFTNILWTYAVETDPSFVETDTFNTNSFSVLEIFEFIITRQIPEMKIIDFLTGLFKMFNLTAYVDKSTQEIVVLPLDDFYANGDSYDISRYVDSKSGSVNVALPYREISFSYEDTESFLAASHNQLEGQEWAKESYNEVDEDGNNLDGGLYKVELPFAHFKYEKLIDVNDGSETTIQWGWAVDDNQDSYIGKPLLFYPVLNNIQDNFINEGISFVDAVDSEGVYTSHKEITGSIVMPSNAISFLSTTTTPNINFKAERNEYWGLVYTETLFEAYYKNYIESVFNPKNRITKLSAYLPLRILTKYTLADRFVIKGNSYKINSITTNLQTGKSDLELLNDL